MKIGFIGFGNMAQALAHGLVRGKAVEAGEYRRVCARPCETAAQHGAPRVPGVRRCRGCRGVCRHRGCRRETLPGRGGRDTVRELLAKKIVVSVAAGVTFDDYERMLAPGTAHLSTIPNTPVSVCEGIVVCERRHSLSDVQWTCVEGLFSKLGIVIRMDTALLGISSTVCGCGPAFVAMFMEALADGAVKHGIPRADAYRMVSQMVAGTGKLQLVTGQHPGVMKDAVCSPGGTTIVGVAELEHKGLRGAVIAAVDAVQNKPA